MMLTPRILATQAALRSTFLWLLGQALVLVIRVYRLCLSPFLPMSCRFAPSCSAYALEAVRIHGPLRGSVLAVRRLLRCHPFKVLGAGDGYDPVPPAPNNPSSPGS